MKPTSGKYEKLHRLFSGIGVAFVTLVFILGFAVLVLGGARLLRSWVETELGRQFFTNLRTLETVQRIETRPPEIKPPSAIQFGSKPASVPVPEEQTGFGQLASSGVSEDLTLSSFTDLFSGVGWIDQSGTTMYQDRKVTAFLFPPVLKAEQLGSPPAGRFVERGESGEDTRCIGSRCLVQREFELLFDGVPLGLPAELQGKQLINISVGNLDSLWLVGAVTRQDDGQYEGWGFYFNGKNFSKVFGGAGSPFISQYVGMLGFGGSDSDWLAIYGAYRGIAYRIREGSTPTDLSYFFYERVMADGFQPVILRAQVAGVPFSVVWYVFSITPGNPKLIKLFQNKTDEIRGVADLTQLLEPARGASRLSLRIADAKRGAVKLYAKVNRGSGAEFWEITDSGFDKSQARDVTSANINNYPAELRTAKISELDLSVSGARVEFGLSGDGEKWLPAALGEEISFTNKDGRRLLWRARFMPDNDPETTPFLDRIRLDYKVKFL